MVWWQSRGRWESSNKITLYSKDFFSIPSLTWFQRYGVISNQRMMGGIILSVPEVSNKISYTFMIPWGKMQPFVPNRYKIIILLNVFRYCGRWLSSSSTTFRLSSSSQILFTSSLSPNMWIYLSLLLDVVKCLTHKGFQAIIVKLPHAQANKLSPKYVSLFRFIHYLLGALQIELQHPKMWFDKNQTSVTQGHTDKWSDSLTYAQCDWVIWNLSETKCLPDHINSHVSAKRGQHVELIHFSI